MDAVDDPVPAVDGDEPLVHTRANRSPPIVWIVSLIGFALVPAAIAAEGELKSFLQCGASVAPFAALGVLAYHGDDRRWARLAARTGAVLVLLAMFAFDVIFVIAALDEDPGGVTPRLPPEGRQYLARIGIGGAIAFGACLFAWSRSATRGKGTGSEVRRLAVVTVVGLTCLSVLPLIVLGEPPILLWFGRLLEVGVDPYAGRGTAGLLRDQLYGLCWMLPAAFFAVGYGVRRDFAATLDRLGLVWPSRRQLALAVGATIGLLAASWAWEGTIAAIWQRLDWPMTDLDAFEALIEFALSPLGAVVIAVAAGVGEEVSIRGVLQPSLGIVASNVLFTALHAFQYGWDALLSVFLTGLVLGVLRRRTSTSVSAITHGSYDFVLVMAAVVERS